METPPLQTKLYIPPTRPELVPRPHLVERLNEGLHRKLALISAPAGFGKTSLVADWIGQIKPDIGLAWLSLDVNYNEVSRFLTYLVAALQSVDSSLGDAVVSFLGSPRPPPLENLITLLVNDLAALSCRGFSCLMTATLSATWTFTKPSLSCWITCRPSYTWSLSAERIRVSPPSARARTGGRNARPGTALFRE